MKLESAALLVPCNSALKGEVYHSPQVLKVAHILKFTGFTLQKISIVKENEKHIVPELELLTKLYDIVIILIIDSVECVGQALAAATLKNLVDFKDLEPYTAIKWPIAAKLLKSDSCPIIYIQRIFTLISKYLDEQLNQIESHLRHYQADLKVSKVFTVNLNGSKRHLEPLKNDDNFSITFEKQSTVNMVEHGELTLAAKSFKSLVKGELLLQNALGSDILSSYWIDDMSDLIYHSSDTHIRKSIEVIEKCLDKYGFENVFLSFNGGKDCTVLLHLVQTVLRKKYPKKYTNTKLFCLYVKSDKAFKEQDEFIEQCMIFYNLEIMSVTGNIKDALRITIGKKPHLKACFMGTRRTDPHCSHLNFLQMTDSDWPQVMRCSPFLDWYYADIWDYILYYKVPYCKLYDYGYTSLGNTVNTIRNPNLLFFDGEKNVYLPAYKMLREKNERSGRNVSKI
ncbi:probable FAD synthase isoform X1 [Euwallacea fornicatus]|uniref:probable FAD synthase isoform X1 n=1 Tax=Euwallacea fornicatus TaxID=995702 RepID=UPI00338EC4D3